MDFFLCQDIGQELPQGTEEMFPLRCGAFRDRHGMDCTGDHKPPAASTSSALSSGCTLLSQARCGFFVAFPPVFSLKIWHKSLLSPSYHILCLLHLLFPSPVSFSQHFHFCCPSCFAACEEVAYFGAFWHILGFAPSMSMLWALPHTQAGTGSTAAAAEHFCSSVLSPRPVACLCQGLSSGPDGSLQSWRQLWEHLPDMSGWAVHAVCVFFYPSRSWPHPLCCVLSCGKITFSLLDIFLVFLWWKKTFSQEGDWAVPQGWFAKKSL